MHSPYVTAFEQDVLPITERGSESTLSAAEADQLALLAQSRPGLCERGYREMRFAQFSGIVRLKDRVLEILPKIDPGSPPSKCRNVLLRLLRQSDRFAQFRHLSASQHLRSGPLLEVFIAAFLDAVAEIARSGLRRQYQLYEGDLSFVRGRILVARQVTVLANRHDKVACAYDELTADNAWNRVLKAALRCVRPWIVDATIYRRFVEMMAVFDEVMDVEVIPSSIIRLIFDRQAVRYRAAVEWARWILSFLSPTFRAGGSSAPALLFDMNQLFESFVSSSLRRRLPRSEGFEIAMQEGGHYLARVVGTNMMSGGLRPDVIVRRRGTITAIADVKWKFAEIGRGGFLRPARDDLYQLQAYAAAFKCERHVLIYPMYEGARGAAVTSFQLPRLGDLSPTIHVALVDVSADPVGFGDCLSALGIFAPSERRGLDVDPSLRLRPHIPSSV